MLPFDLSSFYMIVGFLLASYSVVANDCIQTLGTFINSQKDLKWYTLWLCAAGLMILTLVFGWYQTDGTLHFGRLDKIPQPLHFYWYHAAAPLVLLFLTRMGMPVSTTFLVLSVFAKTAILEEMLMKSIAGYAIAAIAAYLIWFLIARTLKEHVPANPNHDKKWRTAQWLATGFLWYQWLTQDLANIVVYLPRHMSVEWLIFVNTILTLGLGYIFWRRGGAIQKIVMNKSGTDYVRSATLIDFIYAFILLFFKEYNNIPMSTSWVFVGLLCGREFAVHNFYNTQSELKVVFPIIAKDFMKLVFGMAMSVMIVLLVASIEGKFPFK